MGQHYKAFGVAKNRLSGFGGSLFDQTLNGRRHLSANASPVSQTILHNAQAFFCILGDWIVKTNALNEAAIAANTFVGHNNVKKWTGFRTATRKTNDNHDLS